MDTLLLNYIGGIGLRHCAELNYGNYCNYELSEDSGVIISIISRANDLNYCQNYTQSSGVNLLSPIQLISIKVLFDINSTGVSAL